jgi:hypothetical protein
MLGVAAKLERRRIKERRARGRACHKVATRVSSLSLVRYRNNDYSVPTRHGHQEVLAVDRVEIACRGETIATHVRS